MAETDQGQSSSQSGSSEQTSGSAQRGTTGSAGAAASGAAGALVDEAKDVASRLGAGAKELTSEVARSAQDLVKGEVGKRTEKGAEDLSQVAHALRRSGRDLEDNLAAPYVERVADQIERASDYLRTAEPAQMLTSVQNFARREPALFLGGAFAIGFLGARFLKSSARSDDELDLGNAGGSSDWGAGTSERSRSYAAGGSGLASGGGSGLASGGSGLASSGGVGSGTRSGQGAGYGGSSYGAGRSSSYGGAASAPGAGSSTTGGYGAGGSSGSSTPGARGV